MSSTRTRLLILSCVFTAFIAGCSQPPPPAPEQISASPYISLQEFHSLLAESSQPVLVEFGVEIGCFRCDELRPQIERLAEQYSDRAVVRRINLNQARKLAAQLGVTVCPTYIAFVDGDERFRASYPTSGDLLAAQLADVSRPLQMRHTR